ncbi:ATP-binding protein [Amycolatopsis cynarae]|uniref:ATP-binding protein n=2 Tax=Amycolatopsis TaxID=1813 RepID=A0A558BC34_9PSEU|nr:MULTISPECIES: ATP-binding protein [Amycolatopsis]TVT34060.1 ATP-binding protein [Amycolatopsis rhizosphaerae]WAL63606.1 ATP-binding protein [Amycolatopsis sp. HUAS 11-8]
MRTRAEITLARAPEAARHARRFVEGVCAVWRLGALTSDAETVASELVENTLQHTESRPHLRLELGLAGELTVSVSDDNPGHARIRKPDRRGGFGLRLVEKTAADWGCTTTGARGKTVWAKLIA